MKKIFLLSFLAVLAFFSTAQTNLSDIINIYASVTDIDSCTGTLTVEKSTGFTTGMDIILIQMKGAVINTTNTANFGTISDLRSAGLYERATIQAITGNQIVLVNKLRNNYNTDGKVQIVSLPSYSNARIDSTLTATEWDGAKGGVLALEVTDTLTFNADIEVSGKGFRGGIADIEQENDCSFLNPQNDYSYGLNNWRGAAKGEGIAEFIIGKEAGRGAQATGGGGGNDHNAGGGGGANAGAGGKGGNNNEPDILGCDGNFPGIGGKPVADTENRIFLGGGGGAGHENNEQAGDGGNGGGIVLLIAKNIVGNDFKVIADGVNPPVINGDGAGGGGAGGTVILQVENLVSPILVQALGGDGGSVDNQNQPRCQGPGGGGSGGKLLAPELLPISYFLSRGEAGLSTNSTSCNNGTNGAQPGDDGFFEPFGGVPQSDLANIEPAILSQPRNLIACINQSFTISVVTSGNDLQYQWQVDKGDGAGFQNIPESGIYSGTQTNELFISNALPEMADYTFQLLISSDCYPMLSTAPIPLTLQAAPTAAFDYTIQDNSVLFNNTSSDADTYFWDFGDGQTSEVENPDHVFSQYGNYIVTLNAINDCDTVTFSQMINLLNEPTANFSANPAQGCQPLTVTFDNTSSPNATSFTWLFPGGTPAFSTQKNPTIVYNTSGKYAVTLIASNSSGIDTLRLDSFIVVNQMPTANFTASVDGLTLTLTNTSTNGATYNWNFGDNATSTNFNPSHTYTAPGNYVITLTVTNNCGNASFMQNVSIGAAPQALFTVNRANGCAPHLVNFSDASTGIYASRRWEFPGGNPATSTEANPRVVYSAVGQYDVRLIVTGTLGSDTLQNIAFINVLASPTPSFSYTTNGTTVTFNNTSTNAQSYQWTFGDGQTSTQQNPVHNFATGGVYTVTLNASNAYCGRSTSQTIAVGLSSVDDLRESGIIISPNPSKNQLFINAEAINYHLQYQLYKLQGQLLQTGDFIGKMELNLSAFANGMYLLQLQSEDKIWVAKIVKQ